MHAKIVSYGPLVLGIWCLTVTAAYALFISRRELSQRAVKIAGNTFVTLWFVLGIYLWGRLAEMASEDLSRTQWGGYFFTTMFFCFLLPPFTFYGFLAMMCPQRFLVMMNRLKAIDEHRRGVRPAS